MRSFSQNRVSFKIREAHRPRNAPATAQVALHAAAGCGMMIDYARSGLLALRRFDHV